MIENEKNFMSDSVGKNITKNLTMFFVFLLIFALWLPMFYTAFFILIGIAIGEASLSNNILYFILATAIFVTPILFCISLVLGRKNKNLYWLAITGPAMMLLFSFLIDIFTDGQNTFIQMLNSCKTLMIMFSQGHFY